MLEHIDTPRDPVTTTYDGVEVTEDYRWLEDGDSERTKAWTAAQDARTRDYLASVPDREPIRRRFEEILAVESTEYDSPRRGGDLWFALKTQPPLQQPFLVALEDLDDVGSERVLVDPNTLDASGATAIDWFSPSPDGALVAVSLSEHGTEDGTLHVFDVATGAATDVTIPRVNSGTAGGGVAWRGDCTGFWYTRHPGPDERPESDLGFFQDVWFHQLGMPLAHDTRELSGVFIDNRIAENFLATSPDGRWVIDRVQRGDGGEWQTFVREQDGGEWQMVFDVADKVVATAMAGDSLFALSLLDAPHGRVVRIPLSGLSGGLAPHAEEVVPHGTVTIELIAATRDRLWVVDIDGGPSAMRVFDHSGTQLPEVELPDICSVESLRAVGEDTVVWAVETFVSPRTWWTHSDADGAPRRTGLDTVTPLDFSGMEVERVFATSKDGTRVPVNLIAAAGTPKDGTAPAVLYGYGGYAISLKPWFQPSTLLWLEQGGVFAVANIRGGGEYGQEWHHAGRLESQAELLRRLQGLRRPSRRNRRHQPRAARHPRGFERRLAHGRRAHPGAGRRQGGRLRGPGARRAPQRDHPQRRVQRHRVRHRAGPGDVQGAACLLALPQRSRRRRVSSSAAHRRRVRPARRRLARQEDDRSPTGSDLI